MGFDEPEFADNDDAGGGKSSSVSCSICLELVVVDDGRSCVKLICGHEFHLDCIGSAFNSRGAMQCPNCRNTEKGQWLYGFGVPACDDSPDEEFYDLSYSETEFGGAHSCFHNSPLILNHDLLGHQALLSEHASVSSTNQPSPYFSYYGPIHSSSPSTHPSIPDNSYNNHWSTSLSGLNEAPTSFSFLSMDPHFRAWELHRLGNIDQPSAPSITQRSTRSNSSMARPGFVVHPFLAGHSSSARASNNIPSAMIPPYPGSGARTRDHIQAIQAQFQQQNSSPPGRSPLLSATRHSSNHRSSSQLASSSDPTGGYYIFPPNAHNGVFQEADRSLDGWERVHLPSSNPTMNHAERETEWGLIGNGTSSLRNSSGRAPSQGRS
ncbi:hypothetical protein V2J09_007859 [Rumex salicifolius]